MSQIRLTTVHADQAVEVTAGYDRPLREFFLHVRPQEELMDCHYTGHGQDARALVTDAIEQTGITIPADQLVDLMERREVNVLYLMPHNGTLTRIE